MVGGWHRCDWTISRMTSLGGEWHIWIAVEVSGGGGEKEWENQRDEKENEQKKSENKNYFKVQSASEYQTMLGTSAKSIYQTSNISIKAKTGDINTENIFNVFWNVRLVFADVKEMPAPKRRPPLHTATHSSSCSQHSLYSPLLASHVRRWTPFWNPFMLILRFARADLLIQL